MRIRDYAPTDATLHGIADRLQAIQRRNFYQLAAEVSHRGRYYHEYTMSVNVTRDSSTWQSPTEDAQEIVTEALRDLARWLYRQLQAEYDHLTSKEAIEEGIIANDPLLDGLVRGEVVVFGLKLAVEPAGEITQGFGHDLLGVFGGRLPG